MNQIQLLDVAKEKQGLTSDYQLAQRLGVRPGRISDLRTQGKPADEAEIAMLCDMAEIDLHIGLAAVHKDREKNPAKRAYWEKISMQFALASLLVTLGFTGLSGEAHAVESAKNNHALSTNYAFYRCAAQIYYRV